jgi:putative transposase
MSDTFSQIHIQLVFAVKYRQSLIYPSWEDRLQRYITGIVQNKGQKMLAINGVEDHIHLLIGMRPECKLSDLVREIKKSSTEMINDYKLSKHHFQWQNGYGAFSYSKSNISYVCNYIHNQKEHHQKIGFREEYISLLKEFEIDFKEDYLFDWLVCSTPLES